MPAFQIPMSQMMSKARRAVWGLAAACIVAGCATSSEIRPQDVPGSAAEAEVHRLAKTRLQLAALHLEEGRKDVALGEIAQALQAYPEYVDAFNLRGWIQLSQQDFRAAHESFAKALSLRPGDGETLYNMAWLQCQQKQFAAADDNFEASLSAPRVGASSFLVRTWLAKGVCLRQAGDLGQALVALERANEMEPANPAVAYNFSELLFAKGDAERAQFYIRRVNNGQWASAESLWLGIKIERRLGDQIAMRQLSNQLNKRFPNSKEWQRFERGAFDD